MILNISKTQLCERPRSHILSHTAETDRTKQCTVLQVVWVAVREHVEARPRRLRFTVVRGRRTHRVLRAARALCVPNVFQATLIDPGRKGWCTVAPMHVSIVSVDRPTLPESIVLAGTVETIEPLGPVRRVRLRVEGPGGPTLFVGFTHNTTEIDPVKGRTARAVFSPGAVCGLPEEDGKK